MEQYLNKKEFYKHLSMVDKYEQFLFTIEIDFERPRFELHFDWSSKKPNGKFNPIMSAQLIDRYKTGFRKYVTKDLFWDCIKEGTTTQYKVWKKLNDWVKIALRKYKILGE